MYVPKCLQQRCIACQSPSDSEVLFLENYHFQIVAAVIGRFYNSGFTQMTLSNLPFNFKPRRTWFAALEDGENDGKECSQYREESCSQCHYIPH
eukprot:90418-Amphidinium_carterae.1